MTRERKCKICRCSYTPMNSMTKVCSGACALALVRQDQDKAFNTETRRRKKAAETTGDGRKKVTGVFNKFIRLRDWEKPCVSCGRHHKGQYHAGHYIAVGMGGGHPLQFCERNVFKQCAPCNRKQSGHLLAYRRELVRRYGEAEAEWLEGPHAPTNYTIDDLKALYKKYAKLCKMMEKERAG